jgi:hypothetical protein
MPLYRVALETTVSRESPMKRSVLPRQQGLFEELSIKSVVVLPPVRRAQAAQLLSKLLGEVVGACDDHSTSAEAGDEQDQR